MLPVRTEPLALATFYIQLNRTICTVCVLCYLLYQHCVFSPSMTNVPLWIYGGKSLFNLFAEGQGSDRTGSGSGLDLGHSDRLSTELRADGVWRVRLAVKLLSAGQLKVSGVCSVCRRMTERHSVHVEFYNHVVKTRFLMPFMGGVSLSWLSPSSASVSTHISQTFDKPQRKYAAFRVGV